MQNVQLKVLFIWLICLDISLHTLRWIGFVSLVTLHMILRLGYVHLFCGYTCYLVNGLVSSAVRSTSYLAAPDAPPAPLAAACACICRQVMTQEVCQITQLV